MHCNESQQREGRQGALRLARANCGCYRVPDKDTSECAWGPGAYNRGERPSIQSKDHPCRLLASAMQASAAELSDQQIQDQLLVSLKSSPHVVKLTRPTTPVKAMIRTFLHHCCLRTDLAPRRKAYACPASVSVLSTSRSRRSPRCRIESIFWTMMSLLRVSGRSKGTERKGLPQVRAGTSETEREGTNTLSRSERACLRGSAGGAVVYWCMSCASALASGWAGMDRPWPAPVRTPRANGFPRRRSRRKRIST